MSFKLQAMTDMHQSVGKSLWAGNSGSVSGCLNKLLAGSSEAPKSGGADADQDLVQRFMGGIGQQTLQDKPAAEVGKEPPRKPNLSTAPKPRAKAGAKPETPSVPCGSPTKDGLPTGSPLGKADSKDANRRGRGRPGRDFKK